MDRNGKLERIYISTLENKKIMIYNKKLNMKYKWLIALLILISFGCERDVSEDAVLAEFPNTPDVFTDSPVGMGTEFYLPFDGSKQTAWTVDDEVSYRGEASMRFDIPNANDPDGSFAGAIFRIDGSGRNLTDYDALTFWAKASQGVVVDQFGFGEDFLENRYVTTLTGTSLSTTWKKIIIPLPDPSVYENERGMFRYADGTDETGGNGYTFWVDELKYEKLGTIAQPRPAIQNGQDAYAQNFIGGQLTVSGLTQTYNTASGDDVTTNIEPSFFEFSSSDEDVATVNENGEINIVGIGRSTITATMNGEPAEGSILVESFGDFTPAPTPDRNQESVISIFSDVYQNRPVDFFNGFYEPFQTTTSSDFVVDGDNVLYYLNFNFVGIEFNQTVPTINGKLATHLHLDVFVPIDPPSNTGLQIDLVDFGADGSFDGGDDTTISQGFSNGFEQGEWTQIDFDISNLNPRTNLGQIILADIGGTTPPSEFFVDNIYFYRESGGSISPQNVSAPIDFELSNKENYLLSSIGNTNTSVDENPFSSGINTSSSSLEVIKNNGAQFSAGAYLELDDPINFSSTQTIKMNVYSPKANIPIRLALESAGGGDQVFVDADVTTANEWIELEFDFNDVFIPTVDYSRILFLPEYIEGVTGDGSTYYFDDIEVVE